MVSLKVPAPAGASLVVSQTMWKRPVSLGMSPTVAVPWPFQDPASRVTATMSCGLDGAGEQEVRQIARAMTARRTPLTLLPVASASCG